MEENKSGCFLLKHTVASAFSSFSF